MPVDVNALPSDIEVLRQMLAETLSTLEERDQRIEKLLAQLEELRRHRFGPHAEKVDPNQMLLAFEALLKEARELATPPEPEEVITYRRKKGHGRNALPDNLPIERVEHPLPDDQRGCRDCGEQMEKIGEEVTRQLEYEPATMRVIEHARFKYACRGCEDVVALAPLPAQPIEKGLPGPGLLAHVLVSKYGDHLPLYRQEAIFERHGVLLKRSTLCDWVASCADLLEGIYEEMKSELKRSKKIHSDDTPVPVQDPRLDRTRLGRLWVYVGDPEHEVVLFDYTPDRCRTGPLSFLSGYEGYLQADAYAGYDELYQGGKVVEVGCMAHARRRFFEARTSDAARSHAAMAFIRKLYEVEHDVRNRSPEDRCRIRRDRAGPLLQRFKEWLDQQRAAVLPKSPMGEAVGYARGQWSALTRYLEDPVLDIDNNLAERSLRCVAVGRKNWLFAGSDDGGRRAAVIYSLVATCKHHGIDPFAYLRDVLRRLPTWGDTPLQPLLPQNWSALQARLTSEPAA